MYRLLARLGFLVGLLVASAVAQLTTHVTAQVKDTNGSLYVNCSWSVVFVGENTTPGAGPYAPASLLNGQQGTCDSQGNFSVDLADNINVVTPTPSQWQFAICSSPGYVPGGTFCKANILITITGATQDITSTTTPLMPLLPISGVSSGASLTSINGISGILLKQATGENLLFCSIPVAFDPFGVWCWYGAHIASANLAAFNYDTVIDAQNATPSNQDFKLQANGVIQLQPGSSSDSGAVTFECGPRITNNNACHSLNNMLIGALGSGQPGFADTLIMTGTHSPMSISTACRAGEVTWDTSNLYICTQSGLAGSAIWKSISLSTVLPSGVALGSQLVSNGVSQPPVYQTKPVIDVRDAGVDCTGVADSGAALNTLFTNISGTKVTFPYNCKIKTTIQIVIQSQSSFVLHGEGDRSFLAGLVGPTIFGCNAAASGSLLYINRSGYGTIEGLSILPRGNFGPCNTSTFSSSIQIDSTGNPGVTTHDIVMDHLAISTGFGQIPNYVGILVTDGGKQNGEMLRITNSWIHCQNTLNSIGIKIDNGTSDMDVISDNSIAGCFQGVYINGNARVIHNLFNGTGINSIFGAGGSQVFVHACSSGAISINQNEEDTGGPFIDNDRSGVNGCTAGLNVSENFIGVADIASGAYIIDVGAAGSFWNISGNGFLVQANTSQYIIGSASQAANHGPLGNLWDNNNVLRSPTLSNTLGISNLALPFQGGESHTFLSLGPNGSLGPGAPTSSDFSSFSHFWFPILLANTQAQQSPFLALRAYTASVNDDWMWQTIANGSQSALTFNHNAGPASTMWFNWDGKNSGLNVAQLTTPSAPSGVTPVGTAGGTTYTYAVVAYGQTGSTPGSPTTSTATGNASLSSTNYNLIQWIPGVSIGANKWCVWRTVGGATQGNIGCVNAVGTNTNTQSNDTYFLKDTGLAGDSASLPATNTTGQIVSTVPTGLAPFSVASTTNVPNLNASLLLGNTWAAPGSIGGTTPDAGTFTSVTTSGAIPGNVALSEPFGSIETYTSGVCETAGAPTTLNTGATTTDTGLSCLPATAVIDSIVYRITTTITTSVNFTIGDATIAARFCGTQSTLTSGTTGVCFLQSDQTGTSGPRQVSAAKIRVTLNANPGAGAIRLMVFYHTWSAPTS